MEASTLTATIPPGPFDTPLSQEEVDFFDHIDKKYGVTEEEFEQRLLHWREYADEAGKKCGITDEDFEQELFRLQEQARQERLEYVKRLDEAELMREAQKRSGQSTIAAGPVKRGAVATSMPEASRDGPGRGNIREAERAPVDNPEPMDQEPATAASPGMVPEPQSDILPNEYRVPESPAWYMKLKKQNEKWKARQYRERLKDSSKRQILTALNSLKDCVKRCETERNADVLEKQHNELRNHVHKAEFLAVDEYILLKTHLLDTDNGLSKIFSPQSSFPWDLKADAFQLYKRWAKKQFDISLLRGIITSKTKEDNRSADRLDPAWPKTRNFYGQGDLVLGQWWPTQLCTVRDGAHGLAQAGIYGEKDRGACSIIVAGGSGYDDKDLGNEIYYSGTVSKSDAPTESTTRLLESYHIGAPVRVIRSSNLQLNNPCRPERGYRYDGLYKVTGFQTVKQEGAVHRFHLVRLPGQNPIRNEKDKPSSRPTKWEIEAYDKEVAERGFKLALAQK